MSEPPHPLLQQPFPEIRNSAPKSGFARTNSKICVTKWVSHVKSTRNSSSSNIINFHQISSFHQTLDEIENERIAKDIRSFSISSNFSSTNFSSNFIRFHQAKFRRNLACCIRGAGSCRAGHVVRQWHSLVLTPSTKTVHRHTCLGHLSLQGVSSEGISTPSRQEKPLAQGSVQIPEGKTGHQVHPSFPGHP
jgi:hypothetical protein